jgi:hypothetical protein
LFQRISAWPTPSFGKFLKTNIGARATSSSQRLFFAILISLTPYCSGSVGRVQLRHDNKSGASVYSLVTEHYFHADKNPVSEVEKGRRSLTMNLRREVKPDRAVHTKYTVIIRLYEDDGPLRSPVVLKTAGQSFQVPIEDPKITIASEKVTVLDTGQLDPQHSELENEAQSQTGYINFGKPATAGSLVRTWVTYEFAIKLPPEFPNDLRVAPSATIDLKFGDRSVGIPIELKQLAALKKFFAGGYDEEAN